MSFEQHLSDFLKVPVEKVTAALTCYNGPTSTDDKCERVKRTGKCTSNPTKTLNGKKYCTPCHKIEEKNSKDKNTKSKAKSSKTVTIQDSSDSEPDVITEPKKSTKESLLTVDSSDDEPATKAKKSKAKKSKTKKPPPPDSSDSDNSSEEDKPAPKAKAKTSKAKKSPPPDSSSDDDFSLEKPKTKKPKKAVEKKSASEAKSKALIKSVVHEQQLQLSNTVIDGKKYYYDPVSGVVFDKKTKKPTELILNKNLTKTRIGLTDSAKSRLEQLGFLDDAGTDSDSDIDELLEQDTPSDSDSDSD